MMCSSEELGLGKGEDGLLILTPRQPAVGTPLNSLSARRTRCSRSR
jgi:hypothetical protein